MSYESTVAAGPFGDWLARFRASMRGTQGSEVPCGDCTGCCISGYSVQVPLQGERYTRRPATTLRGLGVTTEESERLTMGAIERVHVRRSH